MARYVTTLRTDLSPSEAFAFVADLANLPQWDPGVKAAKQVRGDGPGPDATYKVTLANPPLMTLTYTTTSVDREALTTTLVATQPWFRSVDTITVSPAGDGADVTYDAHLELRGPLALGDACLGRVFKRIGDRATAGLTRALDGATVA